MKTKEEVYQILSKVTDPEIPVLTLEDLGVIRDIRVISDDEVNIKITPTYSGCPATDVMADDIRAALFVAGFSKIKIEQVISPAWTTDWLSPKGKEKLNKYGIAPPVAAVSLEEAIVECPHCGSKNTQVISAFGSTACKALFQCHDCLEPFDYFKCHV
ncbi:MAG TPA: phenylacetate-CoA oxygenase subunit PaaJ [Saprospiraceae bacterium]|nr:phenylacetate-CoA oxygenase subunit PaaJ [Saprospiraceae bacterium]